MTRHHWGVGIAVAVLVLVLGRPGGTAQVGKKEAAPPPGAAAKSFVICYDPRAPVAELARYDVVVVDYAYPPALVAQLTRQKKTVLGYLSLGKVHRARPFVADARAMKIGLVPDGEFRDSFRVDVADRNWHKLVTEKIVPGMKKAGFGGVFLDDLDDIEQRKLVPDMVALIAAIRATHKDLLLMANRGLDSLPLFAAHVDYSLLESCFALGGKLRPPGDPAWAMGKLKAGRAANPNLGGFAVDYYAKNGRPTPAQQQLIAAVRALHAENDLRSCVTTQDLQALPPLPGGGAKK